MLRQHESYEHMLKPQRICYHHSCNRSDAAVPSSLNLNSDSPFSFFPSSSTPVCNHPTHPLTVQPVIRQIRSLHWTEMSCYLSTADSIGLTFSDRHRPKPPVCPPLKGGMGLKTTSELGKEKNRYFTIIECDAWMD